MYPTENYRAKCVKYRNKLKSLLRIAEKNYNTEKFIQCRQDLKCTWKLVKLLLKQPSKKNSYLMFLLKTVLILKAMITLLMSLIIISQILEALCQPIYKTVIKNFMIT